MPFDVEINDRVAELVFNHPPVNAFSSAMWLELPELITSLGKNPDVRCVLIRAEGKGFCAGVDIKELAANSGAIVEVNKGNFLTFKAIHECEIPVVSAPHSFVLGGGIGVNTTGISHSCMALKECRRHTVLYLGAELASVGLPMR